MTERRIYIVRHAIAEDQSVDGRDESRALTAEGRKKMRRAVRGLAMLGVSPARLFASPLVRAQQTAEIVVETLTQLEIETCDALAPGVDERALTRVVGPAVAAGDVMLVGHEPDLSELLAYWLTGSRGGFETRFKKGAVACLVVDARRDAREQLLPLLPPTGKAALEWLMTAGQLGALKE